MAKSTAVLLSFPNLGRLEKMRDLGKEHGWRTSQGSYKNATISLNLIDALIELRHDPVFSRIIEKESMALLPLIHRTLSQYAAARGYLTKRS